MSWTSQSRLRVGILGASEIVAKVHLPVLKQLDGLEVKWIADFSSRGTGRLASAFDIAFEQLPSDPKDLPEADLFLVALPYDIRWPYYQALSRRACAVYVEKPFARTAEEHQGICALFPDDRLACGFHRRSLGLAQSARTILDEGILGSLRRIRFGLGSIGLTRGDRHNTVLQLVGGGQLLEAGVHGIDTALFCSRASSIRVRRAQIEMDGDFELHTHAEVDIKTERGHPLEFELTVSCIQDTINGVEFQFENATLSFSLFAPEGLSIRSISGGSNYQLLPEDQSVCASSTMQAVHNHWRIFLDGLRSGEPNYTSASQSLLTTRVIEGIYARGVDQGQIQLVGYK